LRVKRILLRVRFIGIKERFSSHDDVIGSAISRYFKSKCRRHGDPLLWTVISVKDISVECISSIELNANSSDNISCLIKGYSAWIR
jgi:hypothetical protein